MCMSEIQVKCPTCKTAHLYDVKSTFRPFCSERCRLIDLGAWAEMAYKVPSNEAPTEEELIAALEKQESEGF
jgi:endogenous inhibitor of DNA gyrase (YacG/DUF329 family)